MMTPAPKNPTPDASLAAMRVGSPLGKAYAEHIVNRAAPSETNVIFRIPALFLDEPLSQPTSNPQIAAINRRLTNCNCVPRL